MINPVGTWKVIRNIELDDNFNLKIGEEFDIIGRLEDNMVIIHKGQKECKTKLSLIMLAAEKK